MSLIFKALKKLKSQPPQTTEGSGSQLHKSTNVFSFRRIFFSPLVILLFFITGLFVYYIFQILLAYVQESSQPSTAPPQQFSAMTSQQGNLPDKPNENFEFPTHPENLPSAEIQSIPQRTNEGTFLQNVPIDPTSNDSRIQYMGKSDTSAGTANLIPEAESAPGTQPQNQQNAPFPRTKSSILADMNQGQRASGEAEPWNAQQQNALPTDYPQNPALKKEEILLRAKIDKSQKISSLVSDIEESLQKKEYHQAEQQIETLGNLTQNDNPYFLKIKSFLYVKTERYDQAGNILQAILQKNKNDFEANINMAIIEIKIGKKKNALLRLVNLSKIYPENSTIHDLIYKLK